MVETDENRLWGSSKLISVAAEGEGGAAAGEGGLSKSEGGARAAERVGVAELSGLVVVL